MKKKSSFGLLLKLILGICAGIALGYLNNETIVRTMLTFNAIFGQLLGFVIPLLVLAFVTAGIAELGKNAGKLLLLTVALAFCSTILVGLITFLVSASLLPAFIASESLVDIAKPDGTISAFISPQFAPVMGVISALILAFILGAGIAVTEAKTMLSAFREFQQIIQKLIVSLIIPFLPLYIAGVFANITYSGQVADIMKTFAGVFVFVLLCHFIILSAQFIIAGLISKQNPIMLLKNMLPAYFTALGTQSSAATIPITIECMQNNKVKSRIADFVAPLCANIHMSGSMTTLTICSTAVLLLSGMELSFPLMAQFVIVLSFSMVASPGVPGGSVFTALPFLGSILGFNEQLIALMIALYLTQDSFGTACNVTGDGAIAIVVDTFDKEKTA